MSHVNGACAEKFNGNFSIFRLSRTVCSLVIQLQPVSRQFRYFPSQRAEYYSTNIHLFGMVLRDFVIYPLPVENHAAKRFSSTRFFFSSAISEFLRETFYSLGLGRVYLAY